MIRLDFDPSKISRNITRQQWREIDRWLRTCAREIEKKTTTRMANMLIYGTSQPEIYK